MQSRSASAAQNGSTSPPGFLFEDVDFFELDLLLDLLLDAPPNGSASPPDGAAV